MESRAGWATTFALVVLLAGCSTPSQPVEPSPVGSAHVEPFQAVVGDQVATGLLAVPAVLPTTLVVLAHPWGGTSDGYRDDLQALADVGVLAVAMDFRGEALDFKVKAGVEDTLAATFALQAAYPSVDRTLLYGWSMGGEIAFLAVAGAPAGTFDYVFDGAGVTDLTALWNSYLAARPFVEHETGGTPTERPDEYGFRSPVARVADLQGKAVSRYFIVHGAGDAPVPMEQAERLYKSMADAGLPVSYYVVTVDRDPWFCIPIATVCGPQPPVGVADHEAGQLRLMTPLLKHRIERLPDPGAQPVRGTYDGDSMTYEPSDIGN